MTKVAEKSGRPNDIIASMFVPAAISMIFTSLARFLAGAVDGIITSKFLGPEAYSGVSLFFPMVNIILLFATFIAIGCQVLCSIEIGAGNKEVANSLFTFSVVTGLLVAAIFIILGCFAPDILVRICGIAKGDNPAIHMHMMNYLKGYLFGIPAVILVQVISPFIIIDNGKRLITISSIVLFTSDVAGDLLNVFVFKGGVFGMAIATSVSLWLQLICLCIHFWSSKSYFRLTLKGFEPKLLGGIIKNGVLVFLRTLATILRDLFTNYLNIALATTAVAIAARGIQNDLNTVMFCIGIGISNALLPIVAMYYGADDRQGMKRLFVCSMKTSVIISGGVALVILFGAPLITMMYTNDPEVAGLAAFGIRWMAIGLVFDCVAMAFQSYLQGIQRLKLVNILCFVERFFVPVIVALVMGKMFGPEGILASIAVGKLVLIIIIFLIICGYKKGIPRKAEDYMLLKKDFGVEDGFENYGYIKTIDDAVKKSEEAGAFCLLHGIDKRKANLMALFVEEMAVNIVKHGKTKNREGICVDYRLFVKDERICLTLRDYCEAFDPARYYEIHKDDDPAANIGIRMVMKLAAEVDYSYAFNSNCTCILV